METTQITGIDPTQVTITRHCNSDAQLIAMWLFGRAKLTAKAYRRDADALLRTTGKRIPDMDLLDLQGFAESLASPRWADDGSELPPLSTASRVRTLAAIKSLFSFAKKLDYVQVNYATLLKLPKVVQVRPERILSEQQVWRMLEDPGEDETYWRRRDRVMVKLAYATGMRASELCKLRWSDTLDHGDGQVIAHGKGGDDRVINLTSGVWSEVQSLRGDAGPNDPVFRSRGGGRPGHAGGGHMAPSCCWRVVKQAAKAARLPKAASTHFLRHSCGSHLLDRGATVAEVATLLGHKSITTTMKYLHAKPTFNAGAKLGL